MSSDDSGLFDDPVLIGTYDQSDELRHPGKWSRAASARSKNYGVRMRFTGDIYLIILILA
jgi:hypothetical protein